MAQKFGAKTGIGFDRLAGISLRPVVERVILRGIDYVAVVHTAVMHDLIGVSVQDENGDRRFRLWWPQITVRGPVP